MWAQLIGYVINPEDPTQGTIWVIEDRTEQKRAEESLRNALLENQAILDSAVMGISVVEQGRNLRCNRKMEELFGYAPGEMSPACSPSTPTGGVGQGARRDRARFRGGPRHASEYELVRDGSPSGRACRAGRSIWRSRAGARSGWWTITERREAAEAVRRARDELELRVQERTAELAGANAQLQARSSSAARPKRACITWRITTA
jgi:PAS domain-containing protein